MRIDRYVLGLSLVTLIVLTIPSFWAMLRPGIFSMHDFHVFRMFEYHKCILDLVFPCRWAPDSAFSYGEPLFNFYGQFPYILGEPLALFGLSILTTIKILFIFTLVFSGISMFFLARYIFNSNIAGIVSAVFYVYAPYRAVDVWVRGALPESLAFVFFPLIILFLTRYIREEKFTSLLLLALFLAILLITHNLSFLMFIPFLAIWTIYLLAGEKKWHLLKSLMFGALLTIGLSAFYLFPVLFEGKLITLGKTTEEYYNFRAHYTTLNQLLISRAWGYGASQFGPDDNLSFSAGYGHWFLSLLILGFLFVTKQFRKYFYLALFATLGWFALFLTHGRSLPIWEILKPISYVQFPWRFLSMSTLFLSIAAAGITLLFKNRLFSIFLAVIIVVLTIFSNFSFFREDNWFYISDREQFSGSRWQEQIASAVNDFWPIYGSKIPNSEVESSPIFVEGEGKVLHFAKQSHSIQSKIAVISNEAIVQLPAVYFDGWKGSVEIYPSGDYGQITARLPQGEHTIFLKFSNTPIRSLGNLLSLSTLILLVILFLKLSIFAKMKSS